MTRGCPRVRGSPLILGGRFRDRLGRFREGEEVAVGILQPELAGTPLAELGSPGGRRVTPDLLVQPFDAFGMEVQGSGEGGRARPGRLAPEELQDHPIAGHLAPRGSPVSGKIPRISNPTFRYQSIVLATSVVFRIADTASRAR